MASLGFDLAKNEIRWCVVDGSREAPTYVEHGVENYAVRDYRGELLEKSAALFMPLLKRFSPERVGYRLSLDASSSDQIAYLHFPYAMLISQCQALGLSVIEFNSRSFTAKLLGYDKSLKREDGCDAKLGTHPPNWAKVRSAAMAAWGTRDV
jgi:hypothetical protein